VTDLQSVIDEALRLVQQIGDQAERDQQSYEAGYRAAARQFFDHGVDVGYRSALNEIEAEQSGINARLAGQVLSPTAAQLERIRFDEEHLTASRRCAEDHERIEDGKRVTGRCDAYVRVHYRVKDETVRCNKHRPQTLCAEHREHDSCAYLAYTDRTRRPEYGGQATASRSAI
jgi:hypothetical protein